MASSPLRIEALAPADFVLPHPSDGTQELLDAFRKELPADRTRPEWCFVARRDGRTVGVVGYRAADGQTVREQIPGTMVLFFLDCEGDDLAVGESLLDASLARLRDLGVKTVRWSFETADFWDESLRPDPRWQGRRELAHRLGMSLRQEKTTYRHRADAPGIASELTYRTLQEAGEAAYVEAIRQTMQGTLDRNDAHLCRQLGPEQAARRFFESIDDGMDYEPRLWKLGYDKGGRFVGLVAPLKMWGDLGTLGYVSVAPEHRGKGHGVALLQRGTTDLLAEGIRRVVADTDVLNVPMQRVFQKGGYSLEGRSFSYETDL